MTKNSIKYGTYGIIGFSLVVFMVISFVPWKRFMTGDNGDKSGGEDSCIHWSDTLSNHSSKDGSMKGLDNTIERFIGRWNIRGLSFAVTRNDSLLYAAGYGWADKETGKMMEANTIMRIASASKLVTATAIMKLVDEGCLSLDSKVFGYGGILNDKLYNESIVDERVKDLTVEHLLLHTSGFPRWMGDPMFSTKDIMQTKGLNTPPTSEELTAIMLGRRLASAPGVTRKYSNFGYMVLSLIIEKVTGMSYWDYVDKDILRPAGCFNFRPATNYYEDRHENETRYYAADDEQVEEFNNSGRMVSRIYGGSDFNALKGAGGWCCSAAEMARLVSAIDNYPQVKNVISESAVNKMTSYAEGEKLALGWSHTDAAGKWVRTGTLSSTSTYIERFPDGECWVLITNTGIWTGHRFSSDMRRLVEVLRSRFGNELPKRNLFPEH